MAQFDPIEERAIEMLDDLQLEAVRAETVGADDERFEFVLWILCQRGVAVIERVCRARGAACGLSEQEVELAIEDAAARMLLRLARVEPQPQVHALAAEIATACVERPWPSQRGVAQLTPGSPALRLVSGLDEAIESGRVQPNDWESS
ncbi:MAG: hypothetical protein ACTHO8_08080 [Solirubrobacterales bacterium]